MLKNTENLKEYDEHPYTVYHQNLPNLMTHLKNRCQAAWPFTATYFGRHLQIAREVLYIPCYRYPTQDMNTNSTSVKHLLTPDISIVTIISMWKVSFRCTMRILFPSYSEQCLSDMYTPAVSLKETRGFYLPLVAPRCQGEGV